MHVYTENIVPPCIYWEISSSFFRSKKIYPGKKNTIFADNTRKDMFQCGLFEKIIFSKHLKKISYFHVFFRERSSFIFRASGKIIFSGIRNIIFPHNTRNIIFQDNILERPSFQDVREKKIWFSVKWFIFAVSGWETYVCSFYLKKICDHISGINFKAVGKFINQRQC